MSRSIEVGDEVSLKFSLPDKRGNTVKEYDIRAIQTKPDRINIYLRDGDKSKILTLIGQKILFSDENEPIEVSYARGGGVSAKPIAVSEQWRLDGLMERIDEFGEDLDLSEDINFAAESGDFQVLQFIATRYPEKFRYSRVADDAALSGQVEVLKWLDSFDPPIGILNLETIGDVVEEGRVNVLKYWSGDEDKEGYIDSFDIPLWSVQTFNFEMLEWSYQANPESVRGLGNKLANTAAGNGYMEAIEYLESLDPPIRPNKKGIEAARRNNHLDIVEYLESVPLTKSARKR